MFRIWAAESLLLAAESLFPCGGLGKLECIQELFGCRSGLMIQSQVNLLPPPRYIEGVSLFRMFACYFESMSQIESTDFTGAVPICIGQGFGSRFPRERMETDQVI